MKLLKFVRVALATLLLAASPNLLAADPPYDPSLGVLGGSVSRSAFTSAVVNREPVDRLERVDTAHPYVYYFTDLKGMTGRKVTHRWSYRGHVVKEQTFRVGAPRWRVWSATALPPNQLGKWRVSVINDLGEVVWEEEIDFVSNVSQR